MCCVVEIREIARLLDNAGFVCCLLMLCDVNCFRYEGTVWDDVAQGKGVYATQDGLVRFVFAPLW